MRQLDVEHRFVNLSSLSFRRKLLLVSGIFAVYTCLAALLYHVIGTQTFPLAAIPLIAAGLVYRWRGVAIVWGITLLINTLMLQVAGYSGWDALVDAGGVLGFGLLLIAGILTFKVREINEELRQQLQERVVLDEEMGRQNAELEALYRASLQITHNLELRPILEIIVETALNLVKAEDVHVFSYDGQRITFGAAFYDGKQQPKSISEPRPNGVTNTAVRTGTPIIVPDTRNHPLFKGETWRGAIIALPLSLGNQINGVMNVAFNEPHTFTENEIRILRLLASQASVAIKNAQVYESVRRQASELEQHVNERTSELLAAKERAEAVLTNSFDAIILFDPSSGIEQTNQAFETLFGYPADWVYQQPIATLVHPQWREAFLGILRGVMATGQSMRTEALLVRQDGSEFVADVALAPIPSQDVKRPNVICSVRDISRRKRAEEQQQAMTLGLRMVPAIANELISCPDLDSTLREVVEAARNKLGVERCAIFTSKDGVMWGSYGTNMQRQTTDEHNNSFVIGEKWRRRLNQLSPGEAQWIIVEDDLHNWTGSNSEIVGHGWIAMTRIESADGFQALLINDSAISGSPVDETLQEVVSVFCSLLGKIIERKLVEESIRDALVKEVELGELKSRFITSISHEFRTPLAIIQSSTQLLKFYKNRMDDEKKDAHLDKIESQVQQMTMLLDDVLTISRDDTIGLTYEPHPVDLVMVCNNVIEEIEFTSDERGQIHFTHTGKCSHVMMDENLVRKVISNLLGNAVKYSPPNKTIEFEVDCQPELVTIHVRDEGIGIPEEDQKHLFEDFHRGKNVGAISGTGLGLSIVKRAAQAHGGDVTVESVMGKGTTFTVTFSTQTDLHSVHSPG